MKAVILERIEHLMVKEVPDPQLQEGSVILRIRACSVCSTDLRIYHHGDHRVKLPHILGHEISGEVTTISEEVSKYKVGDRVALTPRIACGGCFYCLREQHNYCENALTFGHQLPGGYAEFLMVSSQGLEYGVLNRIPENLSFEEAALAEPLSCYLKAQRDSKVGWGDKVVVVGGGPVGIMHCRLARASAASSIFLVEKEIRRLNKVDLSAVDEVIDSGKRNPEKEIMELTEGRGADVIIVACSSLEAQDQSIFFAGKGGRVNFFGGLPRGQSIINIDSNLLHYREVSVTGSHGSTPGDNKEALDILSRGA
ncbi:alcohol dehydrogenase catalytic domain-containing protein [Chloroflexota bacterium]